MLVEFGNNWMRNSEDYQIGRGRRTTRAVQIGQHVVLLHIQICLLLALKVQYRNFPANFSL